MPKFYWSYCYQTNDYIRDLVYQKEDYEKEQRRKTYQGYTSGSTRSGASDYARRTDHLDNYKEMWTCRFCDRLQSRLNSLWSTWSKFKESWDKEEPHWQKCLKPLKKETIPKWKEWRAAVEFNVSGARVPSTIKQKTGKKLESFSYLWKRCNLAGREERWIPFTNEKWGFLHPRSVFKMKWNNWKSKWIYQMSFRLL